MSHPVDPSRGWIYVERALLEDDMDEVGRMGETFLAESMRLRGREPESVLSAVALIARARALHAAEVRPKVTMQGRRRLLGLVLALVIIALAFVVVLRAVPR
jgi:hypothetical protein